MNAIDEFDEAREDLEDLLVEVLGAVFGDEAVAADPGEQLPAGPTAAARLAIHDEQDASFTVVEVRTGPTLARRLASRMMTTSDPCPDDILDAIAELGNITGGNVKSLLRHSCRLSLPTAEVTQGQVDRAGADQATGAVVVRARILGQLVELSVHQADAVCGLYWPGATHTDVLEKQS